MKRLFLALAVITTMYTSPSLTAFAQEGEVLRCQGQFGNGGRSALNHASDAIPVYAIQTYLEQLPDAYFAGQVSFASVNNLNREVVGVPLLHSESAEAAFNAIGAVSFSVVRDGGVVEIWIGDQKRSFRNFVSGARLSHVALFNLTKYPCTDGGYCSSPYTVSFDHARVVCDVVAR